MVINCCTRPAERVAAGQHQFCLATTPIQMQATSASLSQRITRFSWCGQRLGASGRASVQTRALLLRHKSRAPNLQHPFPFLTQTAYQRSFGRVQTARSRQAHTRLELGPAPKRSVAPGTTVVSLAAHQSERANSLRVMCKWLLPGNWRLWAGQHGETATSGLDKLRSGRARVVLGLE
jgi:hypothetical protein